MKKTNTGHGGGGGGRTFLALGIRADGHYDARGFPTNPLAPVTFRQCAEAERPALVATLYGRDPEPAAAPPRSRVARGALVLRSAGTFVLSVLAGLAILAAVAALAGCSTTDERREHMIRAGRILLRHSTPEPGWESRRQTWLEVSEIEVPDTAPVASK